MDVDRIAQLRVEYEAVGIDEASLGPDPVPVFERWFAEAVDAGVIQPNTFVLATADGAGRPSARAVLMKDFSRGGLTFYSNRASRKGDELAANPRAAACFVWLSLHRQIRMEGAVEPVSDEVSDAYFRTRPPGARLSAAASPQSRVVPSRSHLEARVAELARAHPEGDVPRPDAWGGYRIVPDQVEFWQGRPNRLHDRVRYQADGDGWKVDRLAP